MDFFSFFKKKDNTASKNVAKDRLKLVLVHDRVNCSSQVLEMLKTDIIKVISNYMEIDEEEPSKQEAYPFPYTTMYTAEGNSGWYCMPEVDDTVLIYFPTKEEKDG